MDIFNENEKDLIQAARLVLSDGIRRLTDRKGLFATNQDKTRAQRNERANEREAVTNHLIAEYGVLRYEVLVCALIDAQGRLIKIVKLNQGKATHCELDFRQLVKLIIDEGACAILLAHNHPSGDNTPSPQDIKVTANLSMWLKQLDCELIDHLVLSSGEASTIMGNW